MSIDLVCDLVNSGEHGRLVYVWYMYLVMCRRDISVNWSGQVYLANSEMYNSTQADSVKPAEASIHWQDPVSSEGLRQGLSFFISYLGSCHSDDNLVPWIRKFLDAAKVDKDNDMTCQ